MNIHEEVKTKLADQGVIHHIDGNPRNNDPANLKSVKPKKYSGWRFGNPKARKGETIGGGYIIFRRGKVTGRVGIKPYAMPFEYDKIIDAMEECKRLEAAFPGEKFVVFKEVY